MIKFQFKALLLASVCAAGFASATGHDGKAKKSWLAGDHHIHSQYSVDWDTSVTPPKPILAGDAIYPTVTNAEKAREFGLKWMVTTDHGGPNHSKVNLEMAYPGLLSSRKSVPEVIQFYGMELDTPGAQHSSLIIPHSHDEADKLHHLEKTWARKDAFPYDETRDTEEKMLQALQDMNSMEKKPVVIVNHPGRSATGLQEYTVVTPKELRGWNDTAPDVAVGMEGAPGHQAALHKDGSIDKDRYRGGYDDHPTYGGFDQMTAILGGFWDSMLAEGRHWWITSTSDSHIHYSEGGKDFWPGEYSKTYVYAQHAYDDILSSIRSGHVFVTTGDLISELYVSVRADGQTEGASIGDTLTVKKGSTVSVEVKFKDPDGLNARGENPQVARVDVITGDILGKSADLTKDTNSTTKVAQRYAKADWRTEEGYSIVTYTIPNVQKSQYLRVRGTNTNELEPAQDKRGEDIWQDLWFYSNPVFIRVE